jgi:hypothetical protein
MKKAPATHCPTELELVVPSAATAVATGARYAAAVPRGMTSGAAQPFLAGHMWPRAGVTEVGRLPARHRVAPGAIGQTAVMVSVTGDAGGRCLGKRGARNECGPTPGLVAGGTTDACMATSPREGMIEARTPTLGGVTDIAVAPRRVAWCVAGRADGASLVQAGAWYRFRSGALHVAVVARDINVAAGPGEGMYEIGAPILSVVAGGTFAAGFVARGVTVGA